MTDFTNPDDRRRREILERQRGRRDAAESEDIALPDPRKDPHGYARAVDARKNGVRRDAQRVNRTDEVGARWCVGDRTFTSHEEAVAYAGQTKLPFGVR